VHAAPPRPAASHLGAVLADAVLQAGLDYRNVVKPRIDRIYLSYPHAANLSGIRSIVEQGLASDFLLWSHPIKISRFTELTALLHVNGVEHTSDLRRWLPHLRSREQLLNLHGIGPKTYDYMCCLVGIDRIAVDRHIKTFAIAAGVTARGYDDYQAVVSCAADLLGMARRDFDAWIWRHQAGWPAEVSQCEML
jgi:hypothetical protein